MTILKLGNAQSKLVCPDHEIRNEISDLLSFKIPGSEFAMRNMKWKWDGKKRLMSKDGTFPSGLIGVVLKYLIKNKCEYTVEDNRGAIEASERFKIEREWKPRDYQIEAREATRENARGVLKVGTGGGKTFIASMIIKDKQLPTLFVTPDTGLREQAFEDFNDYFVNGDFIVSKDIKSIAPVVVSNIQSLIRKDPEFFKRFGMVIIDEFHHSASDSYLKLNKMLTNAYYRYGVTGTFIRADGMDMVMHGVLSKEIYSKTCSELIEEGHLVRPYITIVRHELAKEYKRLNYKRAYDRIIQDVGFNKMVADIAIRKILEEKQTIILVRRKEHGELISNMIDMVTGSVSYINGDDSLERRDSIKQAFNKKNLRCIVATDIFGEGQNIPSIEVLINARLQKTEIQTAQGIGRALRNAEGKEFAEVYDFLIIGQKNLASHSAERINSYKKEPAFKIKIMREESFDILDELAKL